MEKLRIRLENTTLERIWKILYSRLERITRISTKYTRQIEPLDGSESYQCFYLHEILITHPPQNDRLVIKYITVVHHEGKEAEAYAPIEIPITGVVIQGYEPLINTVILEVEYLPIFQEILDSVFDELRSMTITLPTAEGGQDAKQEPTAQDTRAGDLPENITLAELDTLRFDIPKAKQHYRDFSEEMAIVILKALPEAWKQYQNTISPGQWGPRWIKTGLMISPSTVSHYLGALQKMGLRSVNGIELPHRTKNSTK